ncbi:MAG: hypothetical protein WCF84_11360, partial [Anaerolineae bacterium]
MSSSIFAQPRVRAAVMIAAACMMASLLFVGLTVLPASAVQFIQTQDTVADFNPGTFYHTGLTASTTNGGDANGQVRLLNIGINASTWNLGTGTSTGLPSTGLFSHAAALATITPTDYIYVTGGFTGTQATTATCYTSIIASSHQLNTWTCPSAANLPDTRQKHASVSLNGNLYVIGGLGSDLHAKATVYRSSLGSNGAPGAWSVSPHPLPVNVSDVGLYELRAVTLNGHVYVLGGANDSGTATDYLLIGTPGAGGDLTWVTSPISMPVQLFSHMVATSNGRIYVVGGVNGSGVVQPDAYWTEPNADGSISGWTQSANGLQNNLAFGSAIAYSGQIYLSGGSINQGGTPQQTVKSDLLADTGDYLPGWLDNNVLSQSRVNTAAIVSSDGWIYVLEGATGSNGTTPLKTIDYGPTSVAAGTAHYAPSGDYISPPLFYSGTAGSGVLTIQKLHLYTSIPSTTTMTIAWRTSNDPSFTAVAYSSEITLSSGTNIQTDVPVNQTDKYIQYRVTMGADANGTGSPVLNRVDVYYDVPPTNT